ncbi:hypothetical protein WK43_08250 [Burkholderia ubonensis]|nr:hypothetical protein WK37_19280 [Burkholderia ubonensis]KVS48108.1 hypothetical protein WK38_20285 [Burkholderia ubonensis]KVS80963.1 hypothetical protein WK42_12780 [Burkholderia ubonensis]KVS85499.1 hypothetical protein WK44_21805 [Burkholderia ubonensis]KVS85788.1 hypothetical protein WK45_33250 [Burkholderia ubonensis]
MCAAASCAVDQDIDLDALVCEVGRKRRATCGTIYVGNDTLDRIIADIFSFAQKFKRCACFPFVARMQHNSMPIPKQALGD